MAAYQVENAAKVMTALSAYLNGSIEPVIGLCDPSIVWRSIAEQEHAPFGGVYHGREGVRAFFAAMLGSYDIVRPRIVDVIPAGDEVIQLLRLEAEKKDGSAHGAAFVVGRWRFKNGFAVSFTDYFNVPAAIQTSSRAPLLDSRRVTQDPSFAVYQNANAVRVSEILSAYRMGDTGPLFAVLHPNVTWRSLSEQKHARFGGLFRGPDAVRTYFRRHKETLTLVSYDVNDVIPAGDETVHVAEIKARSVECPGRDVFVRLVCFWRFQNGKVMSVSEYFDVPAYLAQLKATPRNR